MNAQHTPGPWIVDGQGIRALVRGSNGVIVAVRHRQPSEEHEANARLIAAAPDMLQMLRVVERHFDTEEPHPVLQADIAEVIAKATGEQA